MTRSVLIVDDDPVQRRLLEKQVVQIGLRAIHASDGRAALAILSSPQGAEISAVVLDLMMPGLSGTDVLAEMRRQQIDIPVVVQTAKGSIDTVVEAMHAGAFDFVVKPAAPEKLRLIITSAVRLVTASRKFQPEKPAEAFDFDVDSAASTFRPVLASAAKAAMSDIPVLIGGETGVGKEWVARGIWAKGPRAGTAFVTVNCGALPGDLVESILFGHAKGAFTDASQRHEGKFVEADGGTLFLDEVGELPASAQVKLLRVLQDGEIDPVGARHPVKTDVRIISATNRNLVGAVADGRFREDLLYRLNAFELTVPPLRARTSEIAALARRFVARFSQTERQTPVRDISDEAVAVLTRYRWPGNIRQLENAIHRAVLLGESAILTPSDFAQIALLSTPADEQAPGVSTSITPDAPVPDRAPRAPSFEGAGVGTEAKAPNRPGTIGFVERRRGLPPFPVRDDEGDVRSIEDIEADLIRMAIVQYEGRMSEVARRLKIGRSTLYRKMREYEIAAK